MGDGEQASPPGRQIEAHQSGSFLIRIWTEGREIEGQAPQTRVFLRNLKTGTEHYLGDVEQLGEEVLRQFRQPAAQALGSSPRKR